MNLQDYKTLLIVVIGILALIVASPALQRLLVYPQTDFFTEMWLLGPEHTADKYPFNITLNTNYNLFLAASNHLGQCAYYEVQVKFRTQNRFGPDFFNRKPSTLPSLYNIHFFIADKEEWELPLTFSFDYSYDDSQSIVNFNQIKINGATFNIKGRSSTLDNEKNGFFGNLFFELWIYNNTIGDFSYHERYNDLKINFTVPNN
jgi:hypothetical protein